MWLWVAGAEEAKQSVVYPNKKPSVLIPSADPRVSELSQKLKVNNQRQQFVSLRSHAVCDEPAIEIIGTVVLLAVATCSWRSFRPLPCMMPRRPTRSHHHHH